MTDTAPETPKDRYISFVGLDCDTKANRLVECLRLAMGRDGRQDPFWVYFAAKLDGTQGPAHDALYHIHSHLNDLRDMLDRWGETDLAILLEALELDCC
jgi:N(2)-fixation sustaining protein CowN